MVNFPPVGTVVYLLHLLFHFILFFLQETDLLGWDAYMTCEWTGKEALYTFYFMHNL